MKIVIAPDSFKGSVTSTSAALKIEEGIKKENSKIVTIKIPVADGGEGTVDSFLTFLHGEKVKVVAEDPLGREIMAEYGWVPEEKTAIIESASASGLPLLSDTELNPYKASTFGTGQLVKHALDQGAKKIIIGLGGSATVDAGTGFLQALGVAFLDKHYQILKGSGECLDKVHVIDLTGMDPRLNEVDITVASDVSNPLLGENGAVYVFGPQKGISDNALSVYEGSMERFAALVNQTVSKNEANTPGSGAAGGFGFSLLSFLNVRMRSGFELIAELSGLENLIKDADLVITGEGKLDLQSLNGKVPVGISRIAKKYNVPVVVFTGKFEGYPSELKQEGIHLVCPIVDEVMTLSQAMTTGEQLLEKTARRLINAIELGQKTQGGKALRNNKYDN
ncbi:glycerate kinase [Bacillus sp. FJAT-27225]|uniref:glycerate kinase family protein n=1 Tax=Bacillus sp. FJAT-27225 TaxID=1743144 RepID=UPI00080C257C|nr:glycerate kinase [Bacillus sp. FJAT-27225]OCA87879.1 glycerate kinase [Bacillus sp. FJAT-27225]